MQIHPAYKYIFLGGLDLLVVGGPYVTRISGTTVRSVGRIIINCLTKACSVEDVLEATKELETSDKVRKFLQDLISQGLLYTRYQPLPDSSDSVRKMCDRFDSEFISLSSKNTYGSIENASLIGYLTNDIDSLSRTIDRIRKNPYIETGCQTHVIASYSTSFETLAITRKSDGNYLYARPNPLLTAGACAGAAVSVPLCIESELVKHWLALVASNKVGADASSALKSPRTVSKSVALLDVSDVVNVERTETP